MKFQKKQITTHISTDYLSFKEVNFTLQREVNAVVQEGSWYFVERTKQTQAVVIIPFIKGTKEVVLIRQFRVPFWKYIIEFPAGLIEEGESIEAAAHRELLEETGFIGKVIYTSPPLAISAGLTSEMASYCVMELDEKNIQIQNLDPVEDIEVIRVKKENFSIFLQECIKKDDIVDCKVFLTTNLLKYFQEV